MMAALDRSSSRTTFILLVYDLFNVVNKTVHPHCHTLHSIEWLVVSSCHTYLVSIGYTYYIKEVHHGDCDDFAQVSGRDSQIHP